MPVTHKMLEADKAELRAEIERLQTWSEKLAAERLQDRAEIERLQKVIQSYEDERIAGLKGIGSPE